MTTFNPRKSTPRIDNKFYKHVSSGGVNKCIHIANGSCLPNCVGYAWGRWYEILGYEPRLSRANAENWWGYGDGYERGQTPRLGAVMCWRKGQAGNGRDGAGHVAIVEDVLSDGSVITSESNYGGSRFVSKRRVYPFDIPGQDFQGFIYLPYVYTPPKTETEDNNVTEKEAIEVLAKMVIAGKFGNGQERVNNIYNVIQSKVNELLK